MPLFVWYKNAYINICGNDNSSHSNSSPEFSKYGAQSDDDQDGRYRDHYTWQY